MGEQSKSRKFRYKLFILFPVFFNFGTRLVWFSQINFDNIDSFHHNWPNVEQKCTHKCLQTGLFKNRHFLSTNVLLN